MKPIRLAHCAALLIASFVAPLSSWAAPTATLSNPPISPEGASGYVDKPGWATRRFAVAAANPHATAAGAAILKAGGSAVDAAVAVQLVLTLVEPQSSGVGGGAFIVHSDGRRIETYDGRETAPAAVDERLFLRPDGKPMGFTEAVVGGRSVGVPGALRALELAHREHGKLPWARLFEPAITLAEQGFEVSHRFHTLLASEHHLKTDPAAAKYFFDADGKPWPVGHLLKNPEYAAVLRLLAREGADALHRGPLAQAIVDAVQKHPSNPGRMTLADLAEYRPLKRAPLCFDYTPASRAYTVCGMPPPSSGTLAIGQIFGLLERSPAASLRLGADGQPSADFVHFYSEAARLAYADRAQYVADPAFTDPPAGRWLSLLDPGYLAERARGIGETSMKKAKPGVPAGTKIAYASMPEQPEYGTSHLSIVDADGNVLAMTTTIEAVFGSRLFVRGFLLNNQLTDFSFTPRDDDGRPVANRVEPGKRPRSSMSPVLVSDKASGQVLITGGSPGGSLIIHYTAKTLYGMLNWGLDAQRAIDLPNFGSLNGPTLLEEKRFPAATLDALKRRGHELREVSLPSGLHFIERTRDGWFGGADPRREGDVKGN